MAAPKENSFIAAVNPDKGFKPHAPFFVQLVYCMLDRSYKNHGSTCRVADKLWICDGLKVSFFGKVCGQDWRIGVWGWQRRRTGARRCRLGAGLLSLHLYSQETHGQGEPLVHSEVAMPKQETYLA